MVQQFREREVQTSGQVPGYQNVRYSPDAFGAQVGRALSSMGQDLSRIGQAQAELDSQKRANDALTYANAAKDELRPTLFDSEFGVFAQQGGNAMGTGATAAARLETIRDQYLKKIEDPETKAAFERIWLRESEATKDSVARHEMNQLGQYKVETAKATVTGAMIDAYNSYTDDQAVEAAMMRVEEAIGVNSLGLPQEARDAALSEAKSNIHLAVLSRWAAEDPYKALDYYDKNKDKFSGKDHITATSFIDAARSQRKAQENVARITGQGGAATNWLWRAMENVESSGNTNAESPKGASGLMQLMPGTAREMLVAQGQTQVASLDDNALKTWLKENPEQNQALGRTYLNQQLNAFGGDLEAALVAYNAGPEGAKAFLAHNAGKRPGERDYDVPGWKGIKNETESYVQKIMAQNPKAGTPAGLRLTRENWDLKNFKPQDLMAPTGGGQWVDARAARGLDTLADVMKQRFPGFSIKVNEDHDFNPITGTAGKRRGTSDPKDNPHVKNSQHLHGTAFDVQVQGWSDEQKAAFVSEARKLGFAGFGFYGPNGHLHIDMGKDRTWGTVPEWAKAALAEPVVRGAGGETVTPDWTGAPDTGAQNFFGPGASIGGGAFLDPSAGALDYWLEQAQLIADPGERERTIAMLRVEAARQEKVRETEAAVVKQSAWDHVIQGGRVNDLTPDILSRLEPSFVSGLYTYEANRASGNMPMDWEAWATIPVDEKELVRIDPMEYRNKLDDEHFDRFLTMYREAQKKVQGQAYDESVLGGARTRAQIIDDIAVEQGWSGASNTSGKKALAVLNRELDRRILGEQQTLGRSLTATEIQDIADKLLIEGEVKGTLWDPDTRAIDAEDPNEFTAVTEWEEVQDDDKQTLQSYYEREFGRLPDQDTAVDLYNRAMRVWLGGKPSGPEEETETLRSALETRVGRRLTDEQFEKAYAKYLLRFLGR
jgi:soluble lytic murein transglycosylase-like protein